jgi:hypothetical protein
LPDKVNGAFAVEDDTVEFPGPLAQEEALHALAEIRSVINRSTRYSTFSALAAFLAGGGALAGSGVCGLFKEFWGAAPAAGLKFVAVWAGVLVFAAVCLGVLTTLKARRRHEPAWTPIARTALAAMLGPGVAGVLVSGVLIWGEHWDWLPGVWLLLYGCGLWAVSFFAPLFLRALGVTFMLLSCAAWARTDLAGLWLGLGFGGLHFIFGGIVIARYQE